MLVGLGSLLAVGAAAARPPHHEGAGQGCGHGGAMAGDDDHRADMRGFHYLLAHRAEIRRTVREVAGGVETLTESDVPAVAAQIQEHVAAMYRRMREGRPIHTRDPLFAEIFRHADQITMKIDHTATGLRVVETSHDPQVTRLIRRHAEVVSAFLANGHREMMVDHSVPAGD